MLFSPSMCTNPPPPVPPLCSLRTNLPRTLLKVICLSNYIKFHDRLCIHWQLKVPCPLHDSWANAKSCWDRSRLFEDYLVLPVWICLSVGYSSTAMYFGTKTGKNWRKWNLGIKPKSLSYQSSHHWATMANVYSPHRVADCTTVFRAYKLWWIISVWQSYKV